jgi:hypothetical protein
MSSSGQPKPRIAVLLKARATVSTTVLPMEEENDPEKTEDEDETNSFTVTRTSIRQKADFQTVVPREILGSISKCVDYLEKFYAQDIYENKRPSRVYLPEEKAVKSPFVWQHDAAARVFRVSWKPNNRMRQSLLPRENIVWDEVSISYPFSFRDKIKAVHSVLEKLQVAAEATQDSIGPRELSNLSSQDRQVAQIKEFRHLAQTSEDILRGRLNTQPGSAQLNMIGVYGVEDHGQSSEIYGSRSIPMIKKRLMHWFNSLPKLPAEVRIPCYEEFEVEEIKDVDHEKPATFSRFTMKLTHNWQLNFTNFNTFEEMQELIAFCNVLRDLRKNRQL